MLNINSQKEAALAFIQLENMKVKAPLFAGSRFFAEHSGLLFPQLQH